MNDKERLKEIEDRYEHQKETAEYAGITMNLKDYEFLIQQAEELHGEEGRHGYKGMWALCNRDYGRLNAENKRYREAMVTAIDEAECIMYQRKSKEVDIEYARNIKRYLNEALEGEE